MSSSDSKYTAPLSFKKAPFIFMPSNEQQETTTTGVIGTKNLKMWWYWIEYESQLQIHKMG